MKFADLKNDFVFRRVFGTHPDILLGFLNDLLGRKDEHAIQKIDYLPSEQLPQIPGFKLSILDVRCREQSGETFIVEMQLLHVAGFMNRVVYNCCKAYVSQLKTGEPYSKLTNVVAISICDFNLWPDNEQDMAGLPRVPMLSRWNMREQVSGNDGLLQLQYAFLELPKLHPDRPASGPELWAWLFVHAPEMAEVPDGLPVGPYREAMELANEASFNELEMEAYQKVIDEIQQARDYGYGRWAEGLAEGKAEGEAKGLAEGLAEGEAKGLAEGEAKGKAEGLAEGEAKGKAEGLAEGEMKAKAEAVLAFLSARGIGVDEIARERIRNCTDGATLDQWISRAATVSSVEDVIGPTPTGR